MKGELSARITLRQAAVNSILLEGPERPSSSPNGGDSGECGGVCYSPNFRARSLTFLAIKHIMHSCRRFPQA